MEIEIGFHSEDMQIYEVEVERVYGIYRFWQHFHTWCMFLAIGADYNFVFDMLLYYVLIML